MGIEATRFSCLIHDARGTHSEKSVASGMHNSGFVRVFESFGKLWKLLMPFSRTWKVVEKRNF